MSLYGIGSTGDLISLVSLKKKLFCVYSSEGEVLPGMWKKNRKIIDSFYFYKIPLYTQEI